MEIERRLLDDILDAAQNLNPGDALDPRALEAIARQLAPRRVAHSVETGAGGSTLLFSHLSANHTAFAIDGENRVLSRLRGSRLLRGDRVRFVEGPTQRTLPRHVFLTKLQAALLDGPHGFPFPQLEYYHLYPHLDEDAVLIVDDIHIPCVHDLYEFLKADAMFEPLEVVGRTALFRRTAVPAHEPLGDGWWLQGYNRRPLLRYTWKERLRSRLPREVLSRLKTLAAGGRKCVRIDAVDTRGDSAFLEGRAEAPAGVQIWALAHRKDVEGWWPQGEGAVTIENGRWKTTVKLGEPEDAGRDFEIALAPVDADAHNLLLCWVEESRAAREWPPIRLPRPAAGLRHTILTVRRQV